MKARSFCLAAALALLAACAGTDEPSCTDGSRNGTETDVDCGGGCDPCADGLRCAVASDCESGACGGGGTCLKSLAAACDASAECASGACADGVCCATACGGLCERCDLAGTAGACTAIAAGSDPDGDCAAEDPSTCDQTGECSGDRTCALYPAGSTCAAAACLDAATAEPADACDGAGQCLDAGTLSCWPYVCAGGACLQACVTAADCGEGFDCLDGVCLLRLGEPCGGGTACTSGFCTDFVCCDAACAGTCERCDFPGLAGTCLPAPAGQDPDSECPLEDPATCAGEGSCSGTGSCALWAAGTTCAPAACETPTVARLADACDGAGACVDAGNQVCLPYACASDACLATCGGDVDCAPGHVCVGGACLEALGSGCAASSECASGHCADSVCCDTSCVGACSRCDLAGTVGACTPVADGSDPDDECDVQAVSTCGTTGVCSGSGSCRLHPADAVCAAATCSDGDTVQRASTCDGSGTCVPGGAEECAPFVCAGGACTTGCTGGGCAPGYTCVAGYCRTDVGGACGGATECVSGLCVDGVCCASACAGICQRCDLPGWAGTCRPVGLGADPDGECVAQAPSTCGTTGACSGEAGSCELHPIDTVCRAAGCEDMITFARADTCDGAGHCLDGGTQACEPYRCSGSGCFTSCNIDLQCQFPEYACSPDQRCLLKDEEPCTSGAQCLHGACCGTPYAYCRNPAVDPNHCGGCGIVCQAEGGSNVCAGGACTPTCDPGRLDCDTSRPNGCEENIVDRPLLQVCPDILYMWNLGQHCGDVKCPSGLFTCSAVGFDNTPKVTFWGSGSQMVWATALECTSCLTTNTKQRVQVRSPDDANYDLYVYNAACAPIGKSEYPGFGVVDSVDIEFGWTVLPDLNPYFIEIRWKSGGSCDNDWRLQIFGTTCP